MLRVPVNSGVLKVNNVNKKGLFWNAKMTKQVCSWQGPFLLLLQMLRAQFWLK